MAGVIAFVGAAAMDKFLETVFGKLFLLLEEKAALRDYKRDVLEEMESWKFYIPAIKSILENAEEKQQQESVSSLLQDLEHLVLDMEDMLDLFLFEVQLHKLKPTRLPWKSKYRKELARIPVVSSDVIAEVDRIGNKLKTTTQGISQLGLIERIHRDATSNSNRRTFDSSDVMNVSAVYGREDEKERMIEWLKMENEGIGVIPIVGMGGSGKTTLARDVFNTMKHHFQNTAWVCVSQSFDLSKITCLILEGITGSSCDLKGLSSIHSKLDEQLRGQRILLVLDDLWNEDSGDWEEVVAPLKMVGRGSKVIVTTRNNKVADMVRTTDCIISLGSLGEDGCWSLFCAHASRDFEKNPNPRLESTGKEILKMCHGLPLAVRTMGGLLRRKEGEDEWEAVLKNNLLTEDTIMGVLRLSYNDLPSTIKRCFSFCAMYPEDYEFKEQQMWLIWYGAGLVADEGEGRKCFKEMVARSLFIPSDGEFVMHDLNRELAKKISKETCCVLEEGGGLTGRTRYLSFGSELFDEMPRKIHNLHSLRTLLYLNDYGPCLSGDIVNDLLPQLRLVRALRLCVEELPKSVNRSVLLRQLDLSHSHMEDLPESICCLLNLEILDLSFCWNLRRLPECLGSLTKLSHLSLRKCGMLWHLPASLKELRMLTTLTNFIVGKELKISCIGDFKLLKGSLRISKMEEVLSSHEAEAADLHRKPIQTLKLEWSDRNDEAGNVVEALRPPNRLQKLSVKGYPYCSFVPSWFANLCFLRKLELLNCSKLEITLPNLPVLLKLVIGDCNRVHCHDDFSLKDVKVFRLGGIPLLSNMFEEKIREGSRNVESIMAGRCDVKGSKGHDWVVPWFGLIGNDNLMVKSISIREHDGMEYLPSSFLNYCSLTSLQIFGCKDTKTLSSLPQGLHTFDVLKCPNLDLDMDETHSTLRSIMILWSPVIAKKISSVIFNFISLSTLDIDIEDASTLKLLLQNAQGLHMLENLCLRYCDDAESFPPEQTKLPPSLRSLKIFSFENLKMLHPLRYGSLQSLQLWYCRVLETLSGECLPLSINHLQIEECDILIKKIRERDQSICSKISHIQSLEL